MAVEADRAGTGSRVACRGKEIIIAGGAGCVEAVVDAEMGAVLRVKQTYQRKKDDDFDDIHIIN